jgi:hypothetical protein
MFALPCMASAPATHRFRHACLDRTEAGVANMFALPKGALVVGGDGASICWMSVEKNWAFAMIGNIPGGTLLVAPCCVGTCVIAREELRPQGNRLEISNAGGNYR